jgi:hypothetical protein
VAQAKGTLLMRPNHPRYWAAKNAWFVEVGERRHQLGKHPEGMSPPRKRKRGDPPPKNCPRKSSKPTTA